MTGKMNPDVKQLTVSTQLHALDYEIFGGQLVKWS